MASLKVTCSDGIAEFDVEVMAGLPRSAVAHTMVIALRVGPSVELAAYVRERGTTFDLATRPSLSPLPGSSSPTSTAAARGCQATASSSGGVSGSGGTIPVRARANSSDTRPCSVFDGGSTRLQTR